MGYGSPAWKFEAMPLGRLFTARSYSALEPGVRATRSAVSRWAISAARVVSRSRSIVTSCRVPGVYRRPGTAVLRSVGAASAVVRELEGEPEVLGLDRLDRLLQVVLGLGRHPQLRALDLGLRLGDRAPHELGDLLRLLVGDPLDDLHGLADRALRGLLDLVRLEGLERYLPPDGLLLEDLPGGLEPILGPGAELDRLTRQLHRGPRALEVESLGDLASCLVNGVPHLLEIDFGHDVERELILRHGGILGAAARRRPAVEPIGSARRPCYPRKARGRMPERPKGAACKVAGLRLRRFESSSSHRRRTNRPTNPSLPDGARPWRSVSSTVASLIGVYDANSTWWKREPESEGAATMSIVRVHNFSISLDGFGTGEPQSHDAPFGHAGERLHEWMVATRWWREMAGEPDGTRGLDDAFARLADPGIGAEIMGAGKFGYPGWHEARGGRGWGGPAPPFHTPVFVLTHHPRPSIEMEGGTTFHFIDGSPAEALETAREAAGGQDVRIGGGPTTVRDFLAAGLVDHMHIVVVPILLGRGVRLWDGLEALENDYEIEVTSSPSGVTHVTFTRAGV